jgi:hypothetical protein
MPNDRESKEVQAMFNDDWSRAWMDEHMAELRQSASGQRLLYQSLVFSFIIGLAAHVGGYALQASAPVGLLGLLTELLYAVGWSLWTGVVVAVFVQVIPEAKARQMKRFIEEYEKLRRDRAPAAGKPK